MHAALCPLVELWSLVKKCGAISPSCSLADIDEAMNSHYHPVFGVFGERLDAPEWMRRVMIVSDIMIMVVRLNSLVCILMTFWLLSLSLLLHFVIGLCLISVVLFDVGVLPYTLSTPATSLHSCTCVNLEYSCDICSLLYLLKP